jgi:dipeptidyl aminopeptidase/acylaminoacyl peptidase
MIGCRRSRTDGRVTLKRKWLISLIAMISGLSAAQSAGGAITQGVPPRALTDPKSIISQPLPAAGPVPVADLFFTRGGIDDGIWIPHANAIVIITNLTGRFNLWTVPGNGGFPLQLTQSDDRQFGLTASPDGKWIAFQSDHGGDQIYDLYATPASGGSVIALTNTPDVDEEDAVFSPDSSALAFTRRPTAESAVNIAIMDFATRHVRQLTNELTKDHVWSVAAFSHDAKSILANRTNAAGTQSEAWTIDVASGAQTRLTPPGKDNLATDISPDGRYVALRTESATGVHQAALIDLTDKSIRLLKPDVWPQGTGHFSPDGRILIFGSNVDGTTTINRYDMPSGKSELLAFPGGVSEEESDDQTAFSPDGSRIVAGHQSSNTPFDYWSVNVRTGAATQLTRLGLASINPGRLPKAQVIHYKSFDGTIISALLWVPFNLARDGTAPAVVFPHGGPSNQAADNWSPNRTPLALASRGFVVVAPNIRGSTGYGRAFEEANHMDLGGGDLKDEIAARQFLIDTGYVDPKRIGMTGGSYGGFMTLMALAKTPDLWAAGVDEYGIIDWSTLWHNTDLPDRQYLESYLGDPAKNKPVYAASSPATYMKNLKAPLLVLQGENDTTVTKDQAEKVVEELKANGRTVESHFYPGEGHGFFKREDQIDALERTVAWFEKYLRK